MILKNNCVVKAQLRPDGQCAFHGATEFGCYVEIHASQLDNSNFVIDQNEVERLCQRFNVGRWYASCESLVGGLIIVLQRAMAGRADSILIRISPKEGRSAEMKWERDMMLPRVYPMPADTVTKIGAKRDTKKHIAAVK
jgi:hypothetical protein